MVIENNLLKSLKFECIKDSGTITTEILLIWTIFKRYQMCMNVQRIYQASNSF
ncbi:hypothetical protein [Mesomycoplasma hyorhinis]|uniref:Uncharacterized protein n=2 Tax=Mesomycoplasma hyorhinis TaxID=2100 RepID=A0AAI8AN35_MESHY|nr:hypothetical protein [Mesomycoplasma hyorhinis]AEC46275.1 hypothetical protein SRH_03690 [Mesomycoplasma hyorhinis MCLD]AFX74419.1 hypothetical protein MOS_504 [Mesomycoplasma hyorhinis SK76]AHA41230.1 hypothetical protein Q453_0503 [Mesomycoplasma hyorhinis DBS 1050]QEA02099.1 hypothetical protein EIH16_06640 [Mesomycoplasma hyorhinis]QPC29417.1 hypothetical protein ISX88_02365 [Mesomycoplasma hyorhinis]